MKYFEAIKHSDNQYQVLDHNGMDCIGEYIGYYESKAMVKRANGIIVDFGSAIITEAIRQCDYLRGTALDKFTEDVVSYHLTISEMEVCLNDRMFLAETVSANLYDADYMTNY